jgi:SAM-dependent methyltransferase
MDLAPGVATTGIADLRPFLARALPPSLAGLRCLDVGTFDGFYAFALEDRGAGEVVGIDVADPTELEHPPLTRERNLRDAATSGINPGEGFALAAAARRSSARWVHCNVYDLTPEAVGGPVDYVVVGTILQHLRDPVRAMQRVHDVLVPGGRGVMIETVSTALTLLEPRRAVASFRAAAPTNLFSWWVPNLNAIKSWARAASLTVPPGVPPTYRIPGRPRLADRIVAVPFRRD